MSNKEYRTSALKGDNPLHIVITDRYDGRAWYHGLVKAGLLNAEANTTGVTITIHYDGIPKIVVDHIPTSAKVPEA